MSQTNAAAAERLALAEAWIAQDPDPETRAELAAARRRGARAGDAAASAELADRFDVAPRLRHRRAPRRDRRRAEPHEPRAGRAGRRRPRRLPARARAARRDAVGRHRLRRPQELGRLRPRHRRAHGRGRACAPILLPRLLPTPVLAFAVRHLDARAGVMVTAIAQPAERQRLQGVPRRRRPRLADRRRPPTPRSPAAILASPRSTTVPDLPRGDVRDGADEAVVDEYVAPTAARRRALRPRSRVSSTRRCTASAGRPRARVFAAAGFEPPARRRRADRARSRLPDRRVPEPRGAGRDGPAPSRRRREVDAELVIANDPDADRLAVAIPDAAGADRLPPPQRQRGRLAARLAGRAPRRRRVRRLRAERHARLLDRLLARRSRRSHAHYGLDFADDAHRLQVDLPRARPRLRLRGGARLPREPRDGARQGRHLGRGRVPRRSPPS